MLRVLLVQCVLLGLMLSGNAGCRGPAFVPPPAAPPPPTVAAKPEQEWIGAGAVARSGVPEPIAPPPPAKSSTWTAKVARAGGHALKKSAKFTGTAVFTVAVIGGIVGVAILYAAAAGNTGR